MSIPSINRIPESLRDPWYDTANNIPEHLMGLELCLKYIASGYDGEPIGFGLGHKDSNPDPDCLANKLFVLMQDDIGDTEPFFPENFFVVAILGGTQEELELDAFHKEHGDDIKFMPFQTIELVNSMIASADNEEEFVVAPNIPAELLDDGPISPVPVYDMHPCTGERTPR